MSWLKSLHVENFRSIAGDVDISLDAPIVLIHGPNGAGKTSLLSAIELALTGDVPSLSRAEPGYLAYLPHRGREFGRVRLDVAYPDGTPRTGDIKVTAGGVMGRPILGAADAAFFSERSYLAQSTLGRLLEIYQHAERKSQSPLTRFVKELLGLDRMEALVNGLGTAGHISRLKGPVPAYGKVREDIPLQEKALRDIDREAHEAASSLAALQALLRERMSRIGAQLMETPIGEDPAGLRELGQSLALDVDEAALTDLVRARREVEVSEAVWKQASAAPGTAERERLESEGQRARGAFDAWTGRDGDNVEGLLGRAGALFADFALSGESGYAERARSFAVRAEADLRRVEGVLAAHEAGLKRRDAITQELREVRTRIDRLDLQVNEATGTNEAYAKALSELAVHIHGDTCPVCDRDFGGAEGTSLAAHLSAKIGRLVEQAGRLQALARDRGNSAASAAQLERQLATAQTQLLPEPDLSRTKARAADLVEVSRQLGGAMPLMQEGDRLRGEVARVAASLAAMRDAEQAVLMLQDKLVRLWLRLGADPIEGAPTSELLYQLKMMIEEQETALGERQRTRRLAADTVASLIVLSREIADRKARREAVETTLLAMRRKKDEADKLIDLAKDLSRQTREARGRVVRNAFNDELNAIWRDLFVRLAPEEPFIPAFAIPEGAGTEIEAVLETHHRQGGRGGNPQAMLSAGNLNTAALTLFLALHLSVERRLPCLVIDDPVQSMDEVHIAQFAALLRTFSKQMKRQVIIAVHERSLFDYLALELSPAFEGDRLNVIELGRNAVGQTTCHWDAKTFVEDKAIAA
ncbi:AAA family ATPase [Methylobacterium sp. J-092]|uniref:AAA family ATPase n=1 Tax=Methylobacterium sp. J-092 TaxID=2836667 RepID=UPI001FBB6E86|nr:AAA family ATPase [Methylobacterium sp. J-092]MCJ2007484.1 AAA family ATPase [Methylobacterium sp. J-092]